MASSSITLDVDDDFPPSILPPQDLLPHAPSTDTDIIAPWTRDDFPAETPEPQEHVR